MAMADSFARGFGLMDAHLANQDARRLDRERLDMQKQQFDQSTRLNDLKIQGAQVALDRDATAREREQATMILGKVANGLDLAEDEVAFLRSNPKYNPFHLTDERTGQALKALEQAATPNSGVSMNDPTVLEGANFLFRNELNKGSPGEKRIVRAMPGREPGTLVFELEVKGEDGKTYHAPMTVGRDSNPEAAILQVPVDKIINRIQGARMLRQAFMDPQAQKNATKLYQLLGGKGTTDKPVINEFYDEQGQPYKAQWANGQWVKVGHSKAKDPKNELPASIAAQATYFQKALGTVDNQLKAAAEELANNFELTPDEKKQLRAEIESLKATRNQYLREYEQVVGLDRNSAPEQPGDDLADQARQFVDAVTATGQLTPSNIEAFLTRAKREATPEQYAAIEREAYSRISQPGSEPAGLADVGQAQTPAAAPAAPAQPQVAEPAPPAGPQAVSPQMGLSDVMKTAQQRFSNYVGERQAERATQQQASNEALYAQNAEMLQQVAANGFKGMNRSQVIAWMTQNRKILGAAPPELRAAILDAYQRAISLR